MKTTLLIMLFLVSVLFAVDRASGQGSANKSRLSFVDLTDDFDRVWAETKDVARDRRVEAFEAEFGKILPGFYSADRVKDFITPEHYHDMILKGLEDHQPPRCHPTRQRLVHQTHHARAPRACHLRNLRLGVALLRHVP